MISKKLVAASILAAMGTSAHAIGFKAGDWEMDISGSINAYYTSTSCDNAGLASGSGVAGNGTVLNICGAAGTNQDNTNIQNGLLPGFIIFSASTRQAGYDLKGVISIDPGTTRTGTSAGGAGQDVGDQRRVYLQFGNENLGTFKFGRDVGLFGQNAIFNDMSLVAVGGGSGFNGALNTTLGSIGQGYIYTAFKPQISYASPAIGNLQLSGGLFQYERPFAQGTAIQAAETDSTSFQGMATYKLETGKLWAAFVQQADASNTDDLLGYEVGGTVGFGNLQLTTNIFAGEGVGTGIIGLGGFDSTGRARDSDGYLVQATYKVGDTKFGINYGSSSLDRNTADIGTEILKENNQMVLGIYHSLTPSLTLAGEYITGEQEYQGGNTAKGEANTIAVGAILFF